MKPSSALVTGRMLAAIVNVSGVDFSSAETLPIRRETMGTI